MPAMHRRVRCLERVLRSHVQTIQEISFQIRKSKEGAADKRYSTVWKIFWEEGTTKQTQQWHI